MKLSAKKVMALALAGVMGMSLAACSGSGSSAPKTGDNSPAGLYAAVLLAAAGTAGVTAARRKVRR